MLDSVSSPHSKPAYEKALEHFRAWGIRTGAAGFSKATVQAYHAALEASGLAASTVNVRLSALRKLAAEAAAVSRVKGAKRLGVWAGNWLSRDQVEKLLSAPDPSTNRALLRRYA